MNEKAGRVGNAGQVAKLRAPKVRDARGHWKDAKLCGLMLGQVPEAVSRSGRTVVKLHKHIYICINIYTHTHNTYTYTYVTTLQYIYTCI